MDALYLSLLQQMLLKLNSHKVKQFNLDLLVWQNNYIQNMTYTCSHCAAWRLLRGIYEQNFAFHSNDSSNDSHSKSYTSVEYLTQW